MATINTRQVEAFRAVMLTGGMTAAAELLGITQPAVSRLVRDFETRLGLALFERRGNAVAPTPDAGLLLAEVQRSFVGLDRIAVLAGAIRTQTAGSLRIASMPAIATSALPRFVGGFLRDRPNLRVSLLPLPSHLVVEAVAAGQAEFGYAMGPLERPGFVVERLPARAVAILPEGHRLADRTHLVPADFAGETVVSVASGELMHARVETALAGVERRQLVETAWSQTACLLVAEGAGIGIVDPFSAGEFAGCGLAVRRFEPRIEVGLVSLRLPQRPVTPLAATFAGLFAADLRARDAGEVPTRRPAPRP